MNQVVRFSLFTQTCRLGGADADKHPSYFGQLRIKTSDKHPDIVQMRAAGFMEGRLTHKRINDHVTNVKVWIEAQTDDLEPIKRFMRVGSTPSYHENSACSR